ncbi:MAG: glycosyltransferase family 39 protein [Acidobacteriota bacterium]|nr:glycosyltransferase family 39 protein [Acidobacteriota bacterium]
MNALLAILALALSLGVSYLFPEVGGSAVILCAVCSVIAAIFIGRSAPNARFLLQIFVAGVLVRMALGSAIYFMHLQEFFGGDAFTYDGVGWMLVKVWKGQVSSAYYDTVIGPFIARNWGMPYLVAFIYTVVGRNLLAVQFFNAVVGAATAPIIFFCALHIFQNLRVAKLAAFAVAFYPSIVLWSSQGLKDGPVVFLLALAMLATLKLGERISPKYLVVLVLSMFCLISLRFYLFYMVAAAVGGAFVIGMRPITSQSLARQLVIIVALGLGLTYMGVLRTAGAQFETYGSLEAVQRTRADLAQTAKSGFGQDVDVSTTGGALTTIPLGFVYLMFAPFPWQLANLRQSITLPEMIVWWCSFPLLVTGVWFTLRHRFRQSLPILIFTSMLTLAYSIFQGNVGTAYRQRSQLLIFYFIFVAVGAIILRERREERQMRSALEKQALFEAASRARAERAAAARERYDRWKRERGQELERMADNLSERDDN